MGSKKRGRTDLNKSVRPHFSDPIFRNLFSPAPLWFFPFYEAHSDKKNGHHEHKCWDKVVMCPAGWNIRDSPNYNCDPYREKKPPLPSDGESPTPTVFFRRKPNFFLHVIHLSRRHLTPQAVAWRSHVQQRSCELP
jgi:hypothetical protein